MTRWLSRLGYHATTIGALALLVLAMGGTWLCIPRAGASPLAGAVSTATTMPAPPRVPKPPKPPQASQPAATVAGTRGGRNTALVGKLDINTATAAELEQLPTIGPAKAARIVEWRQKNGAFRRTADLRRVKGIGYKTFKLLEPYVDVAGPSTLAPAAPAP